MLRQATRRRFTAAGRTVVLGDGAAWIWSIAQELFPRAIQIVDRFHVKQHLSDLGKAIYGARLKRAGMHWTTAGANAIIALRCCRLSGRFQDFWERRTERQKAA